MRAPPPPKWRLWIPEDDEDTSENEERETVHETIERLRASLAVSVAREHDLDARVCQLENALESMKTTLSGEILALWKDLRRVELRER